MLNIPLEKLAYIVMKAREFDVKVEPVEPDPASNPTDDMQSAALEDYDDSTEQELADALNGLNEDEREELVALMWLGRGDYDKSEWADALLEAHAERNRPLAEYLMGTPLLGDYIENAIAELGYSLADYEAQHL